METILDAAIQNVEKPEPLKQWIRSWLRVIGCSSRLRAKYSVDTFAPNSATKSDSSDSSNSTNETNIASSSSNSVNESNSTAFSTSATNSNSSSNSTNETNIASSSSSNCVNDSNTTSTSTSTSTTSASSISPQVGSNSETPCSIEHLMRVLYDRYSHPSSFGRDVSLVDDLNEAIQTHCSCGRSTHFACFSVLYLIKRKLEQPDTFISDWLDYVLNFQEKQAVQMMKRNDYFRSDNSQIQRENDWMDTLRFALPLIVPLLTIPEVCFLRKRLFSRLRKIGCLAAPKS